MPTTRRPRNPRSQPAHKLLGAAAFSGVHELKNGVLFLRLFKQHPQFVDDLIARTSVRRPKGDKRDPGSWTLLYLAFLLAEGVDIQPWYSDVKESGIWAEAGFERPMGYSTVHLRFSELEHPRYVAAFEDAVRTLIELAIEHDPRICRHMSTDGTQLRTSARLEHCCVNTVHCRSIGRTQRHLMRPAGEDVRAAHDAKNAAPETDVPAAPSNALKRISDQMAAEHGLDTVRYSYWMQSGHLYRSRDKTAGGRMYSHPTNKRKKRFNFGGVCQPMTDTTTGLPVALHFSPADRNEHTEYPELYRKAVRNMGGRVPVAVVADRGLSFKEMFEFHARRGVGLIVPDRNPYPGQTYENLRTEKVDEDGMPRCPAAPPAAARRPGAAPAWASRSAASATPTSASAAATSTSTPTARASSASTAARTGGSCARSASSTRSSTSCCTSRRTRRTSSTSCATASTSPATRRPPARAAPAWPCSASWAPPPCSSTGSATASSRASCPPTSPAPARWKSAPAAQTTRSTSSAESAAPRASTSPTAPTPNA